MNRCSQIVGFCWGMMLVKLLVEMLVKLLVGLSQVRLLVTRLEARSESRHTWHHSLAKFWWQTQNQTCWIRSCLCMVLIAWMRSHWFDLLQCSYRMFVHWDRTCVHARMSWCWKKWTSIRTSTCTSTILYGNVQKWTPLTQDVNYSNAVQFTMYPSIYHWLSSSSYMRYTHK